MYACRNADLRTITMIDHMHYAACEGYSTKSDWPGRAWRHGVPDAVPDPADGETVAADGVADGDGLSMGEPAGPGDRLGRGVRDGLGDRVGLPDNVGLGAGPVGLGVAPASLARSSMRAMIRPRAHSASRNLHRHGHRVPCAVQRSPGNWPGRPRV